MASFDLQQLSDRVYYLAGGVNTVIAVQEQHAVLIDTGQDKTYGKYLRQACEQLNVVPAAIINTHSHADHYGGNDYLLRQFDIPVYAPEFETSIIQSPYLEPVYLFNGAKPPGEMLNKWLLAKPSPVHHTLTAGELELYGLNMQIFDTRGHAHQHISVLIDDVLIASDAVFGEVVLEKYALPFGQDIAAQIASAKSLKTIPARVLLPGHGAPTEAIDALIDLNLRVFQRASDTIWQACTSTDTATILKRACDALSLSMRDVTRYYLNLCTVQAYLTYLREQGSIDLIIQDNTLLWTQTTT